MQRKNYKKAIVFALVLTMLMPLGSMAASSAEDEADTQAAGDADTSADSAEGEDTEDSGDEDEEEVIDPITDEQAIALETCAEIFQNDNFILYGDEENDRLCLYVKESGKYLWTSPINVMADQNIADETKGDTMKNGTRKQIASSLAIKTGDLRQEKRTESSEIYSNKARAQWEKTDNGVVITYNYSSEGIKLKVHYEVMEDHLYVYVDTNEIEEANTSQVDGRVITKLQLCPSFSAVPPKDMDGSDTEGYMIVPDGSGAVIEYNNGKSNYGDYSQIVYGRDYTAVPLNAPRVTEQAYMPVLANVSGNDGVVMIASEGDSNVYAKARISGQDKQVYNTCWFEFEMRSTDTFFMSGDSSNKITVFEKNGIKTPRFGVKYYPIHNDDGVNYADCAAVYRNYLETNKGLTKKTEAGSVDLHLDFFGGVMKEKSIVGIPFNLKTEMTGFKQAQEIVDKLKEQGVDSVVVNYNDWTNASIKGKISTKAKASGVLGGNGDFMDFIGSGADVFPSMNNIQMDSGSWGYSTFTNTAIRISNAYSRQSTYNPAFGTEEKGVSPALLSPQTYVKVFDEMIDSYKDKSLDKIGFGDYSTKLVSDYSKKKQSSRFDTMNTITEGYKKASESVGEILCDGANAYVLPYATQITNVPVYSSGFNLTDYDIPFYQMVIHGYIPYSTKPINASSNTGETFMLSLAAGSNIHYDMIYEDASEIKDTDYDDLYYTNYAGWIDMAATQYNLSKEILSGVSDMVISKYEISEDGNVITTTYSKDGGSDVTIVIDKAAGTASVDGNVIDLGNAIEGGTEANE